jgi:hypothetical protein
MFWTYYDFFLWFLWQLPQNIVALFMIPFMGKMTLLKFEMFCFAFECSKMKGGISLGNFIFLSPSLAKKDAYILHEYGHVVDSMKFGWLYLFIVGIPSLLWAIFKPKNKCYYSWYTEKWANKNAGLNVRKNQYGCYLYSENK